MTKANGTLNGTSGHASRLGARHNIVTLTSGLSPTYLQANLVVLPSHFARDFRLLCQRNPVPCPLIAESSQRGSPSGWISHIPGIPDTAIAADCDIRTDVGRYMVYRDGVLTKSECNDLLEEWNEDNIAFLIGCSFSFESSLTRADLEPRHTVMGPRNNPMYKTNIPLCAAGVFTSGTYVVSMRPYPKKDISRVRDISRPYVMSHGEPIAWGWDAVRTLGIKDIDVPDWGDAPLTLAGGKFSEMQDSDDDVPVFWGCGVTPQVAVVSAKLPGLIMAHAPGHMLILDVKEDDALRKN